MPTNKDSESKSDEIIRLYQETGSIRRTAKLSGKCYRRVKKELLNKRLWSSETTEEVQKMKEQGKKDGKIAEELGIEKKNLYNYIPYKRRKGRGYDEIPETSEAIRSYNYRKRMEIAETGQRKRSEERKKVAALEDYRVNLTIGRGYNFYSSLLFGGGLDPPEQDTHDNNTFSCPIPVIQRISEYNLFEYVDGSVIESYVPELFRNSGMLVESNPNIGYDIDMFSSEKYYLRLSLDLGKREGMAILKDVGQVENGIIRDILVPGNLPLGILHLMVQRAFGWQDYHWHEFELSDKELIRITDGTLYGFLKLAGEIFQISSPSHLPFRDDRWYHPAEAGLSEGFRTWLKKQYARKNIPWSDYKKARFLAAEDAFSFCQAEFPLLHKELGSSYKKVPIKKFLKYAPLSKGLLEAASVKDVFRHTKDFYYMYDPFGDKWKVKISLLLTKQPDGGVITPKCIFTDGLPVLEDIGGIKGYVKLLSDVQHTKTRDIDWTSAFTNGMDALPYSRRRLAEAMDKGWCKRSIPAKSVL